MNSTSLELSFKSHFVCLYMYVCNHVRMLIVQINMFKPRMSSNSLQILKSLREENINMCHFLLLLYPHLCSGEGKKLRKYIVSFKLKQSFILMKEEKAFVDFIITRVHGFSSFRLVAFTYTKMCMMRKLHKYIQMPRLTLGFHFLRKYGCTYAMLKKATARSITEVYLCASRSRNSSSTYLNPAPVSRSAPMPT